MANNNAGGAGSVTRVDAVTHAVAATVPVGNGPVGIALTANGARAWVANGADGTLSEISTATNHAIGPVISTGAASSPYDVAVAPDGHTVWVTNPPAGTVLEVNTARGAIEGAPIPVGTNPKGIAISPDGRTVWVAVSGANNVVGINTATRRITATIAVGVHPTRLAVSPNGEDVWVSNNADGTASQIDTRTRAVVALVSLPNGRVSYPNGVAISPVAFTADGPAVWVVNDGPGTISEIDPVTGSLVGTPISVGGNGDHPIAVAVSPDGNTLWVTNLSTGTVAMIAVPNVPLPPEHVRVIHHHGNAVVRWRPPTNTGGSGIVGYAVTAGPGGPRCDTVSATSCVLHGIGRRSETVITVTATNADGTSLPAFVRERG